MADELLAPNFVSRDELTGEEASREDLKQAIFEQASASSDLLFSIVQQIAEGDKVVTRNIGSGTHNLAEYMELAPSNARITIENVTISRVVEGKIVEERVVSDSSPLWQRRMDQERIEREGFEQELLVARRIQHALLPNVVLALVGWAISPYYQPAREVGGDLLRLSPRAGRPGGSGDRGRLRQGDSCSRAHGQHAERSAPSPREGLLGQMLTEANEVLCTHIPPNMFVTCFFAILDPENGRLSYASAGHTLPCCKRHVED